METTGRSDKPQLYIAASNAKDALRETYFTTWPFFRNESCNPEPERCLAGFSLGFDEIEAGFAVDRHVKVNTLKDPISIKDLPAWLVQQKGKTFLLLAEAGEGKSTFKNILMHYLMETSIILEWCLHDRKTPFQKEYYKLPGFLTTVHRFMRREATAQEPNIIVFGEALTKLSDFDVDSIRISLKERENSADHSVVLITGRPGDLRSIKWGVSIEEIRLQPLNKEEAGKLCENLRKAYSMLRGGKKISDDEINYRYPNLLHFLNTTSQQQAAIFLEFGKPLLAGLLQAAYGKECLRRIKEEFEELESPAKTAYMHICLASLVGEGIPEDLLRQLAPKAELNNYCNYNPWIRIRRIHRARHSVFAQTVIERLDYEGYDLLTRCLESWLNAVRENKISSFLAWSIFDKIAQWELLAPAFEGKSASASMEFIKNSARKAIRNCCSDSEYSTALLDSLIAGNEQYGMQWSGTIHNLTPKSRFLQRTITKKWVERSELDWNSVSKKLTEHRWAVEINPTAVRLKVDLDATTDAVSEVFGNDFLKILPILKFVPQNKCLFLFEINQRLLKKTINISLSPSLKERAQYYLDKTERDAKKAQGQKESLNDLWTRVAKWWWLTKKHQHQWGDLLADLFHDAATLIKTLNSDSNFTQDSNRIFEAYLIAVVAFENLRIIAGDSGKLVGSEIIYYSELINKSIHNDLSTKKLKIFQEAWKVSAMAGNPNPRIGIRYAGYLPLESKRSILRLILDKHPDCGIACLQLALCAEPGEEQSEAGRYIQAALKANLSGLFSGLSLSFLYHAKALIGRDPNESKELLYLALKSYHAYVRSKESLKPREVNEEEKYCCHCCKEARQKLQEIDKEKLQEIEKEILPTCPEAIQKESIKMNS